MLPKRKRRIQGDFPAAAKLILDDYQAFLAGGPHAQEDGATKAFAARHAAARAALAHLEQLLKLAADNGEEDQAKDTTVSLAEWRARMPPQDGEEPEADDEGDGS